MACDMAAGHALVPICALPGSPFAAAIALLMLASAAWIMARPERNGCATSRSPDPQDWRRRHLQHAPLPALGTEEADWLAA